MDNDFSVLDDYRKIKRHRILVCQGGINHERNQSDVL